MKRMSVAEIEEAQDALGTLLDSGSKLLGTFFHDYEENKSKDGFDINEYFLSEKGRVYTWLNQTLVYLRDTFGQTHHYIYHFSHPTQYLSMDVTAWPLNAGSTYFRLQGHLATLDDIAMRLEEKLDLTVRQEIAKLEHDQSIKYELKYSTNRELSLNGILLSRPDFLSENDNFLSFLFESGNAWRKIPMKELLEYMKVEKLSKTIHQILTDLHITGSIKEVFMPNVSAKGFEFRNPVTYGFVLEHNLPTIELTKPVRTSKK